MMASAANTEPKVRLTVRQFEQILDTGMFEGRHVELLGGELFEVTKNPPHDFAVLALAKKLEKLVPEEHWTIREEKAIELAPLWRPEPDVAVARGSYLNYQTRRPGPSDIDLVIEVTETSQDTDRGTKHHGYAAAGLPVYWIVDLVNRVVEVHSKPIGSGDEACYTAVEVFDETREIALVLSGQEYGRIAVKDILPAS
ncbi:MAG: Uma2 family endonuclease [Isosphaeraceae bacterium]